MKMIMGALTVGLGLALSQTAFAGGSGDLTHWKRDAGRIVSWHMTYPTGTTFQTFGNSHAVVKAVIDRDGRVLKSHLANITGHDAFERESRSFVRRLDSLPALPDSIAGDRAVVRIHLLYAERESDLKKMYRTIVETQQIAEQDAPAELGETAGLPVIDMFAAGY